jgi:hypothetical protein
MNKIKKFVSNLLRDLFTDNDKKELIDILTTSLEEKVEDLVEQGTPVDKAIEQSIQEFGSADDVLDAFPKKDQDLHQKVIRKRKHELMYSVIGYLLIVGIVLFINLQFIAVFQYKYWFIVVAIGTLFWPATMLYRYLVKKK